MITKKISGRGRPRGFDLDGAISTARALFHRRGYDAIGVAELSTAIGISAPSLYTAFGSKRQLFERVLRQYVKEEGGWLPVALDQGETVEAAITHLFVQAAEVYTRDAQRPGCLVLESARNCADAEVCALNAEFRQATRALIRDRIAEEFPDQADTLANYALTMLMGLSAAARDGRSKEELLATAQIAAAGFSVTVQ